ncbi:MAG: undecaprenyldiphospho-muramoylpentapeptide beta-N-acetylglucosaminyltransferase [Deltaproteobacteria bacterium]|nr:undecaprenyldiphospho-muramoylpentapeptide beta-N-acetylglucosaminyltransferase [Deltaproteobacteria bacterium]
MDQDLKETGEKKLSVIIAGGGTGGHLFPGIAVGNEFKRRCPDSSILFVTAGREIESQILDRAGFRQECLRVEGIKGKGIVKSLASLFKLPGSLFRSMGIIKRFSPDIILGVGGYSSGPLCLAGWLMRVPVVIHEQNSYPGLTNRLLSRVVDRIFISFEESRKYFPAGTLSLTGNPVRDVFTRGYESPRDEKDAFTIFVTGGSQGAVAVNSVFIEALSIMKERGVTPGVIHHAGRFDYERVLKEYNARGLKGEISAFLDNMPEAYKSADIFIGRAGAGTIFELAAMGRPAILIPLPTSANNHQVKNAMALVRAGGAEMLMQDEVDGKILAEKLTGFMNNRGLLGEMGKNSRKVAVPDSAKIIVDHMYKLTGED